MRTIIFSILLLVILPACAASPETEPAAPAPISKSTPIPSAAPASGEAYPAAVLAAQADLAKRLGLQPDQVSVASVEQQDWPDGCLGLARPDEMCTMAIVPGYLVRLSAAGQDYAYRSDLAGKNLRPEVFKIPRKDGENPGQALLSWSREGGIAGYCDTLTVSGDGSYTLESCKGKSQPGQLSESQAELLQFYAARLEAFEMGKRDPAVADAMSTTLTFNGVGAAAASDSEQQAVAALASEIVAIARANAGPDAERDSARKALEDFLNALNSGDFILGAKLYGGETELLETWNPDIQNDLPKLLERGCTQNGLQCLPIRSILYRGPDTRGGYQFLVEFTAPDGNLFHQGPCCGDESEGPFPASFTFAVLNSEPNWLVMDLPPYLP